MKKRFLGILGVLFFSHQPYAANLNDEQEYYLGRSVAAHILAANPSVEHEFNEYMTAMVRWMAAFSPRPTTFIGYRVSLIDSPFPTALSAPGGYIFISKEMLKKIDNEDQLAGILAHELAHIISRHGEKTITKKMDLEIKAAERKERQKKTAETSKKIGEGLKKGSGLLGALGVGGSVKKIEKAGDAAIHLGVTVEKYTDLYADTVSGFMTDLMTKGFSKKQEHQADDIAVYLMAVAGYDARELANFLAKEKPSVQKVVGQWQSTHPLDSERIKRVQQRALPWEFLGTKDTRNKRYLTNRAKVLGK